MTCYGSKGLSLCPRDMAFHSSGLNKAPVITRQDYTFNALNRMTQVKKALIDTTQQKTLNKVVNYGYGDAQVPLRLQQISTEWNEHTPVTNHFIYDAAGNMITDGDNNQMTYNAFNQITQVTMPDGKQSHYSYDGGGREVKETTSEKNILYMMYISKSLVGERIIDPQQRMHTYYAVRGSQSY